MTSLYDYLKANGESSDVYDTEFDLGVCWDIPDPQDRDDWAKVSRFMLRNIEYVSGSAPYSVVADKSGFVRKHIRELKEITRMYYNDEYQVKGLDDDSIYNGVELLDDLQVGNFPDVGYAEVVKIFGLNKPKAPVKAKSKARKPPVKTKNKALVRKKPAATKRTSKPRNRTGRKL